MLSSLLGSPKVVMTDRSDEVLHLLSININRNFSDSSGLFTEVLKWGFQLDEFKSKMNCNFNIILGSDLIYNDLNIHPLCKTLQMFLGNGSQFWMVHVFRDNDLDTKFLSTLNLYNFKVTTIPITSFIKPEDIPHNEFVPPESLQMFIIE